MKLHLCFLTLLLTISNTQAITINTDHTPIASSIPMQNWKSLRDARVVKQDLDFSCGAASMATILNEFYGQNVTEEQLLKAMNKSDGRASFDDMQRVLPQFGFMAQGFAADYAQLQSLKIPVVVYLKHRKDDHFSVLRGINETTVWLADSSLGNRTYSKVQFLSMWQTRDSSEGLYGKILAVVPSDSTTKSSSDFFTKAPTRQSAAAQSLLQMRVLP